MTKCVWDQNVQTKISWSQNVSGLNCKTAIFRQKSRYEFFSIHEESSWEIGFLKIIKCFCKLIFDQLIYIQNKYCTPCLDTQLI